MNVTILVLVPLLTKLGCTVRWMWPQAVEWAVRGHLDRCLCLGVTETEIHGKHLVHIVALNTVCFKKM